jgi:hypothetical protein
MGWDDRKRQLSVLHWFGSCGVFSMLFLLFARLGRGEYLIGCLRASVEYYGVSSRRTGKNMGEWASKEGNQDTTAWRRTYRCVFYGYGKQK